MSSYFRRGMKHSIKTRSQWTLQNICRHADALYMLKGWEHSLGARAEHAVAVALRLPIAYEGSV